MPGWSLPCARQCVGKSPRCYDINCTDCYYAIGEGSRGSCPGGGSRTLDLRAALALLLVATLNGCTMFPLQQRSESRDLPPSSSVLPETFQTVLSREPGGTSVWLAESPWGMGVTLVLHDTYWAASGRFCRKLTVQTEGPPRLALACQGDDGIWERVRLLQEGGWPVFDPLDYTGVPVRSD